MHRVLTSNDYRHTAWKNGGGRTMEIATYPPQSDIAEFHWRASVADIERDGPFSLFPGVDRILVLLRGAGILLSGAGEPCEIQAPYEPLEFAGDVPLDCRLRNGPVRDFNLMLRREFVRGDLTVVRAEAAAIRPARFRLCYAAAGACECLFAGRVPLVLHEGETLVLEAEGQAIAALHVNPLSADAVMLVAAIDTTRDAS